jgi:hypothetical protein
MKQFRLSTLMLLIVIAALIVALVVQYERAARREAEQREQAARREADLNAMTDKVMAQWEQMNSDYTRKLMEKDVELAAARERSTGETTGGKTGDQK